MIRTVTATRYVTPLREGGSLPAIIEADDDGMYVLKFRGAGQGCKSLIAELVAGEIARALGLLMPELVFVELDPMLARSEPDSEIQALIKNSAGLNIGLDYLPGSLAYDPLLKPEPKPELASGIAWFDAYVSNVDRTRRNTNLMMWHKRLWLIDHGATLYFHHAWSSDTPVTRSRSRFPQIKDHVLLPFASAIADADATLSARLTPDVIQKIVALIPDSWLNDPIFRDPDEHRAAYVSYLLNRLERPRLFVEEAIHAHAQLV
ncbi:MAG: HipA family kinase [Ardenticatenaceae bacterium]